MAQLPILTRYLPLACIAVLLSSCSYLDETLSTPTVDYKQSKTAPSTLEVPPDLSASKADDALTVPAATPEDKTTYSAYSQANPNAQAAGAPSVLPAQKAIRVERDGDKRWLVIQSDSTAVWNKMREFWLQNGFLIKREDPRTGILETDWAENRADIPMDPVRKVLSKAFDTIYSSPTRDMFHVRLETGSQPGTTELFLTHRGMKEVLHDNSAIWEPRPSDPELESEMLNRLMVFMGEQKEQAKQALQAAQSPAPRAQLTRNTDGTAALTVEEDISRAWRRTGLALDRIGFSVEDRDRSKGLYFVRYDDPMKETKSKGILSSLAFWRSDDKKAAQGDKYQITLESQGANTLITVRDKDGKPVTTETGARILTLLQEQLK
jgi:outer membrane protein assembly factor BamC